MDVFSSSGAALSRMKESGWKLLMMGPCTPHQKTVWNVQILSQETVQPKVHVLDHLSIQGVPCPSLDEDAHSAGGIQEDTSGVCVCVCVCVCIVHST